MPHESAYRDADDEEISLAPPRPHVTAGTYEAYSRRARKGYVFKRQVLVLEFDLFEPGGFSLGSVPVARAVPCFFRVPPTGRLAPSSKLFRVAQLAGVDLRAGRLPLRLLVNKAWRVEVRDVSTDQAKKVMDKSQHYSVVADILDRLA